MSLSIVDALAEGAGQRLDRSEGPPSRRKNSGLASSATSTGSASGLPEPPRRASSHKMIEPFVGDDRDSFGAAGHQIDAGERERLAALLKSLRFNIKGPFPLLGNRHGGRGFRSRKSIPGRWPPG